MVLLRSSLIAAALCSVQTLAQTVDPSTCAQGVHVIAVRGRGTDDPPYGLSTTTVSNITAAIPGSDVVAVDYDTLLDPVIKAAIHGGRHTKRYIRKYVRSCPDTKIVVQGYSQGAIAAMTAMCGGLYTNHSYVHPLERVYAKNVIAIVTYGDETRNKDAPYNEGTCLNGSAHPRVSWECGDNTNKIKAWCDADDPDCCLGGDNIPKHFEYPDLYNADLVNWVVEQYNASNPPTYTTTKPPTYTTTKPPTYTPTNPPTYPPTYPPT